jgi:hypothetical protein
MKFLAIHLSTIWLVLQATSPSAWGSGFLRGPSSSSLAIDAPSSNNKFDNDKRYRGRAVEEEEGGTPQATVVPDDLLPLAEDAMQLDTAHPEEDIATMTEADTLNLTLSNSSVTTANTTASSSIGVRPSRKDPLTSSTCPTGGKAEVWVGHHHLQSNLNNIDQAVIWVISSNPDHHANPLASKWTSVPSTTVLTGYKGLKRCAKFYSIGAGEGTGSSEKKLVGEINRPDDVSHALHKGVFVMDIDDPIDFKAQVELANEIMNDNFLDTILQYQAYPRTDWYERGYGWVEFNFNGYITGLLSHLGHTDITLIGDYLHGWDKPVPKVFFEQSFSNTDVKTEVFKTHQCEGGLAEVWVGYHKVFTQEQGVRVDHAKMWVISSDPLHHQNPSIVWKDLRRDRVPAGYEGDKNCAKFYTFGAGFTGPDLVAGINYPSDVNIDLSGAVMVKSGVDPVSLKGTIDDANTNMMDCFVNSDLKRDTSFPRDFNDWGWGWEEFNDNGYISGLLKFLEFTETLPNGANLPGANLPGWSKDIPVPFFEVGCTSTLEAQLMIFDEHPAEYNLDFNDLVAEAAQVPIET